MRLQDMGGWVVESMLRFRLGGSVPVGLVIMVIWLGIEIGRWVGRSGEEWDVVGLVVRK